MPVGDFKFKKTKDAKYFCEFCRLWIHNNSIQKQRHESDERHLRNKKKHIESVLKKQGSSSSSSSVSTLVGSKVQQPSTSTAAAAALKNQELVFGTSCSASTKRRTDSNQEEIIGLGQAPLQIFDSVSSMLNKVVTEGVGSVAAAGQWVELAKTKEEESTEESTEEKDKERESVNEEGSVKVGQNIKKNLINAYEDEQEDMRVKLRGGSAVVVEEEDEVNQGVDSTTETPTTTTSTSTSTLNAFKKRKIVKANIKKK